MKTSRRVRSRLFPLLCLAAFLCACGSGKAPTAPTPTTSPPATPPNPSPAPPTIAQVGGTWRGSFEVQLDGVRFLNTMELTLQQTDRVVRGSWRTATGIRTPDANAWFGDVTGTIALASNGETVFVGSTTLTADTQRGTGACRANVAMEGTTSSGGAFRWTGPNFVQTSGCANNAGGLVWVLSKDADPPPPPPTPPPPGPQLSCTASVVSGAGPSAATMLTFDEPEIDARRTRTISDGSYASCPYRTSDDISQFSVLGMSLQGRYVFRGLWNGCSSSNPSVWEGGVLQTREPAVTLAVSPSLRPTTIRFSLGVDGQYPSARFDLRATDGAGATATTSVSTLLGRVSLSCANPIASVQIGHDGPSWILDSVAF
jgi:hypothetical protein